METKTKHHERRKYRRFDMPTEKGDAFLLWDDQAVSVDCVNFSAGGCAIFCETKFEFEFEIGKIVFLKNDQGKFRVRIANIIDESEGVRLGCEYLESVISEHEMLQSLKPEKRRKFNSSVLSDPAMLMGLVAFSIVACVIYTLIANHNLGEESDDRMATLGKHQNGPKNFSRQSNHVSRKKPKSLPTVDMQKRVKLWKEESKRYLGKVRERIAGVGIWMNEMGIDLDAIIESLKNVSISDTEPKDGSSENSADSETKTSDN